jgi:hypothetical protein
VIGVQDGIQHNHLVYPCYYFTGGIQITTVKEEINSKGGNLHNPHNCCSRRRTSTEPLNRRKSTQLHERCTEGNPHNQNTGGNQQKFCKGENQHNHSTEINSQKQFTEGNPHNHCGGGTKSTSVQEKIHVASLQEKIHISNVQEEIHITAG